MAGPEASLPEFERFVAARDHERALLLLDTALIPSARNPELKKLLQESCQVGLKTWLLRYNQIDPKI